MKLEEKLKAFKGTIVLREWDYGTNIDFWLVPMANDELEKWWISQNTFDDNPPLKNEILDEMAKRFNEERPKEKVWTFSWPGKKLVVKNNRDTELWMNMYDSKRYYFCHVYSDEDSFLTTPDERRIHHRGFSGKAPNQAL